jgi:Patatin-like phospholipase
VNAFDSGKKKTSARPCQAISFGDVLLDELALVRSREWHRKAPPTDVPEPADAERFFAPRPEDPIPNSGICKPPSPEDPRMSVAYQEAHYMDLSGLALSGGGIRSASFNLGLLQALARARILNEFDYLSTVSGGGYIGGWLTAWIKREGDRDDNYGGDRDGLTNIERQLDPSRVANAKAQRVEVPPNGVREQEPEPIAHLRAYSNYLAPRPSLMYRDWWVLGAIYVRNCLLNQLILLPAAAVLLLVARLFIAIFYWPRDGALLEGPISRGWYAGLALAVLFVVQVAGCYQSWVIHEESIDHSPRRHLSPMEVFGVTILPLLLAAVLFSRAITVREGQTFSWSKLLPSVSDWLPAAGEWLPVAGQPSQSETISAWVDSMGDWIALMSAYTLVQAGSSSLFGFINFVRAKWTGRRREYARWFLAGIVPGAVGGTLIWCLGYLLNIANVDGDIDSPPFNFVVVPPLAMGIFVLVSFVHTGIFGSEWRDGTREWWASVCAAVVRSAISWTIVVGIAAYGGWLLSIQPWLVKALLGASWFTSLWESVRAGRIQASALVSRFSWKRIAESVAPYLVVLGALAAVSWLLDATLARFPSKNEYSDNIETVGPSLVLTWLGIWSVALVIMSFVLGINANSLHAMYRNRLIRCYLGASRQKDSKDQALVRGVPTNNRGSYRKPNPITGFDPTDDIPLSSLGVGYRDPENSDEREYWGPLLIVNTALNLVSGEELAWQERMADSFVLTPTHCGSRTTGYRRLPKDAELTLGTAMAVSGAAVSSNMGYQSRRPLAALLTILNIRLGRWFRNPRFPDWLPVSPRFALPHLVTEMFGMTHSRGRFIYLSDGGHFDNLGVFELVRRRCRFIVASDSAADRKMEFADLSNLIRKCRVDLGIRIEIELKPLRLLDKETFAQSHRLAAQWLSTDSVRLQGEERFSLNHVVIGAIHYEDVDPGAAPGMLVYVKSSLTGDEPADVFQYAEAHPAFPHENTVDQFFDESQFESYRALGYHIGGTILQDLIK